MESDGRLFRYFLTGTLGDALFAIYCSCGFNISKILAHLRKRRVAIIIFIMAMIRTSHNQQRSLSAAWAGCSA